MAKTIQLKIIKNSKLTVIRTVFVVVVSGHSVVDFPDGDIDSDGVGNGLVLHIDQTGVVYIYLHCGGGAPHRATTVHHDHLEFQYCVGFIHLLV